MSAQPGPASGGGGLAGRVPEFDLARVLAIAAVIALHVTAIAHRYAPELAWAWALNRALISYAAPVLLIVAGALSWNEKRLGGRDGFGGYLAARARRVLVPYLIWAAGYLALNAALGVTAAATPLGYLELVVTGLAYYHLWFVPAVLLVYVAAPLGARLAKRHPLLPLVAAYALAYVVIRLVDLPDVSWLSYRSERAIVTSARYFPYAAWGALYAWSPLVRAWSRRMWPLVAAAAIAGAVALAGADGAIAAGLRTVGVGALGLSVLGACAVLGSRWPASDRGAARLAPLVYVVYLAHPMVLALGVLALDRAGRTGVLGRSWAVVALYAGAVALGGAIAWLWDRVGRAIARPRSG